jgi:glycosyltransferase involved in cell wall biosynthesis
MKVLYISHHRENSAWGEVAINNILALDSVGVHVVPRAIKLDKPRQELPQKIIDLEKQDSQECDVCIQHVLPHYLTYNDSFTKNICIYETETEDWDHTSWPKYINMMDEAWVPCFDMTRQDYITIPKYVIPHAQNMEKYQKTYEPLPLQVPVGNFTFYFIGEYNRRKNISALVRAFYTEFSTNEPVSLVLKINKAGSTNLFEEVSTYVDKIKQGLRLYQNPILYKPAHIITDWLSDDDIMALHLTCDCLVIPSHGEAWCQPAFDAMAMGNPVVATCCGGMADYLPNDLLVDADLDDVFAYDHVFPSFGTAREQWYIPKISDIRMSMREAYNLELEDRKELQQESVSRAKEFSYQKVGVQMKERLYAQPR